MQKRIVARKNGKLLVQLRRYYDIGHKIRRVERFEVWTNEDKLNQGISSEIIDGKYIIYSYRVNGSTVSEVLQQFVENF